MALLNILQFPHSRLKKVAEPIDTFDQELALLVNNMFETLYEERGVGLAATQVNVHKRVIVIDASQLRNEPFCLVNPEILASRGTVEYEEGCLSFHGVYAKVKRAKEFDLKYRDHEGRLHQITVGEGLLGNCIQHEIDHLNGITFYDHLSSLKQTLLRSKLEKLRKKTL